MSTGHDHRTTPFDRRTFIASSALAAAGLLARSSVGWAQDIRRAHPSRVVATVHGRVRGVILDGDVNAFYGVPYGASTAGEQRFMPPSRPASWSDVRDAVAVAPRSPQDF